jgi:hypothetical protein
MAESPNWSSEKNVVIFVLARAKNVVMVLPVNMLSRLRQGKPSALAGELEHLTISHCPLPIMHCQLQIIGNCASA